MVGLSCLVSRNDGRGDDMWGERSMGELWLWYSLVLTIVVTCC